MSLRVWLPLNGDLHNQGLDEITVTNSGAVVDNSGKIGKCYSFNGSSYITVNDSITIGTGDFSLSVWFYLIQVTGKTYQPIVSSKTAAANSNGFAIYWNQSQNKFLWSTADGSGATEIWTSTAFDSSIYNTWHHIVMVRNASDSKHGYFYIDGVRYELASIPPIRNITSASNFLLGWSSGASAAYRWTGKLNDFRLYDYALSAKEIKEISKALVLHYSLDGVGANENLLKRGDVKLDNASYYVGTYAFTDTANITSGETYTFSFDGELQDASQTGWYFNVFPSPYNHIQTLTTESIGHYSFTFTMPENGGQHTSIGCYSTPLGNRKGCAIWNAKLEKGSKATPWIPAPSDPLYTKMGFDKQLIENEAGYSNQGTAAGTITSVSGSPRYNQAIHFDGNKSYFTLSEPMYDLYNHDFTYSVWLKPEDKTRGVVFSEYGGAGASNVAFELNASLALRIYWNGSPDILNGATILTQNEWNYVAITKTDSEMKFYVNGVLKYTYTQTGTWSTRTSTGHPRIGDDYRGNSSNTVSYMGGMSDFRFYATALSPEDIKELYEVGMSIDNKQNIHTYEIGEAGAIGISKTGILTSKTEFIEEADDPDVHLYKSGEVTANHFYEE